MKDNNLNEFNTGGLHSQNPLGGIPMGINPQGQQNTVEEGETRKGNFVYSNRIVITPEIASQFGLGKADIGKTVADVSKSVNKKFDGRNDRISTSTKNSMLDKLAQAQEMTKALEQQKIAAAMQANSTEVPDMMNGQVPQGMEDFAPQNKMFFGGPDDATTTTAPDATTTLENTEDLGQKGSGMNTMGAIGAVAGAAAGMMPSGDSRYMNAEYTDPSVAKAANRGKAIDATKGAVSAYLGPIGMAFHAVGQLGDKAGQSIGGKVGGGVSAAFSPEKALMTFQANKSETTGNRLLGATNPVWAGARNARNQENRLQEWKKGSQIFAANQKTSDFSDGGNLSMNPMKGIVDSTYNQFYNPGGEGTIDSTGLTTTLADQWNKRNIYSNQYKGYGQSIANEQSQGLSTNPVYPKADMSKVGDTLGSAARYAPIAMNAYQLATLKKPEVESLDRLRSRFKPEYVDEKSLQNIAGNEMNNQIGAITQMGASEGAMRNSILAAGLNKTKALGQAYMEADGRNKDMNIKGQEFNLGVDSTNLHQSNTEKDWNARNRGNYETQKSKLLGEIGTNIGDVGKEQVYKQQAAAMLGYSWRGKYLVDKNGKRATPEEIAKARQLATTVAATETTTQKKLGGYLLNNKGK
jgi:hypothetical protein